MSAAPRVTVLDEVRGFAALYVAVAHLALHHLGRAETWTNLPWRFGQEAVMIFIFVSGAAIRLSVDKRGSAGMADFLRRRFVRLFPMVVLGLAAGYATACIADGAWKPLRGAELLGNLLFLQDFSPVKPGTICSTYYGNAMLWSLSYEWWFYVAFALLWTRVAPARRTDWAGAISLVGIAGLAIQPAAPAYWAAYFIVWWAGGTLVDPDRRERRRAVWWLGLTAIGAIVLVVLARNDRGAILRPGVYPVLVLRHLGVSALVFAAIVAAEPWLGRIAARFLRGFAWAAPMSYALYVVHYPLAADAHWLRGTGLPDGVWAALTYGGCALAMAWLAHRYFEPWAQSCLRRIPGLVRRSAPECARTG